MKECDICICTASSIAIVRMSAHVVCSSCAGAGAGSGSGAGAGVGVAMM